jgi:DNA-binding beta-propeller fold protein YncE
VAGLCLVASTLAGGCGGAESEGVLRVNRVIGEPGRQPGQFSYPRGLAAFELDGRRMLAVVDKTARLQLLDAETGEVRGAVRTPRWSLGMPTGLTVAPHPSDPGRQALWVADTHEHQVLVYALPFDNGGQPAEPDLRFGAYGYEPGQFVYPTDIAVLTDDAGRVETVFVSEYGGNDRVSVFGVRRGPSGVSFEFERQIGTSGVAMDASEDDPAALSRPQSIALRHGGRELVVATVGRHRVVRFDVATGDVLGWTDGSAGADGSASEPMVFPYGLSLAGDDHAVVSEFGASRLRVIELDTGRTVATMGGPGRAEGQLATPWSCEVVGDELIVLDSGNDRIQVLPWPGVEGVR